MEAAACPLPAPLSPPLTLWGITRRHAPPSPPQNPACITPLHAPLCLHQSLECTRPRAPPCHRLTRCHSPWMMIAPSPPPACPHPRPSTMCAACHGVTPSLPWAAPSYPSMTRSARRCVVAGRRRPRCRRPSARWHHRAMAWRMRMHTHSPCLCCPRLGPRRPTRTTSRAWRTTPLMMRGGTPCSTCSRGWTTAATHSLVRWGHTRLRRRRPWPRRRPLTPNSPRCIPPHWAWALSQSRPRPHAPPQRLSPCARLSLAVAGRRPLCIIRPPPPRSCGSTSWQPHWR